jgi:hypothetical protein
MFMKIQKISLTSLILLIMTGVVSCSPGAALAQRETGFSLSPTQVITENRANSGMKVKPPFGDESNESVKLARLDLAQRLAVSVESITVTAVIGQEFSANAFYCRATKDRIAKDESSNQISGFSILLNASGRRYEYHAGGQRVTFCRQLP